MTEPMGWNRWNAFHGDIDEEKILTCNEEQGGNRYLSCDIVCSVVYRAPGRSLEWQNVG